MKTENLPGPFEVDMPEVYQIELSSACNFNCVMCPREKFGRVYKEAFFDIELLASMIRRGDLDGSYFLEFQMSGEPLLHPQFNAVVELVKRELPKLKLGMSTNGYFINRNMKGLRLLDYITISVDSLDNEEYAEIRVNGDVERLRSNIVGLLGGIDLTKTVVDLQLVELPGYEERLKRVIHEFGDKINGRVRTVPDCFLTLFEDADVYPVKRTPCLNPWLSVSVQSNGNVVPCCFSFGDDIILGNLNNNSLREIWNGDKIKELRQQHTDGTYASICSKCYMRSPTLLHWELFTKSMKGI